MIIFNFKLIRVLISGSLLLSCSVLAASGKYFPTETLDNRALFKIEILCDIDNSEIAKESMLYLISSNERNVDEMGYVCRSIIRSSHTLDLKRQEGFIITLYPGGKKFRISISHRIYDNSNSASVSRRKESDFYIQLMENEKGYRAGIKYEIKWTKLLRAELAP